MAQKTNPVWTSVASAAEEWGYTTRVFRAVLLRKGVKMKKFGGRKLFVLVKDIKARVPKEKERCQGKRQ